MSARQRRWILAALTAWVLVGTSVGEFRDPPFDLVRFLVRLVLGGLMAWFLFRLFTSQFFQRRGD